MFRIIIKFEKENKMPGKFCKIGLKKKAKSGRGTVDAEAVIEAMKDCWAELAAAIDNNMSKNEQAEMLNHFNGLFEDCDDLGEVLFGSYEDFEMRINMLDANQKATFCNELQEQEIINFDAA